jgi:hypothetical protein
MSLGTSCIETLRYDGHIQESCPSKSFQRIMLSSAVHKVDPQLPPLSMNLEYNMSSSAVALPTNKCSIRSHTNASNDSATDKALTEGTSIGSINSKNERAMNMIKMKLRENENVTSTVNPKFGGYSENYFIAFMQGSF